MNYAIVEINGKQIWVEKGKFYDINRINSGIGSTIKLCRVLLIKTLNATNLGHPDIYKKYIIATILKHLKGPKIIIYKMKPKKKMKHKFGFRKKITRILIETL
jgi:large subunit ribosomal protein L21